MMEYEKGDESVRYPENPKSTLVLTKWQSEYDDDQSEEERRRM